MTTVLAGTAAAFASYTCQAGIAGYSGDRLIHRPGAPIKAPLRVREL